MSDQLTCGRRQRRRVAGFTLVELMIVVVIVGILSAIAIPTFSDYIYKARTAEATEFLGVIKLREEAYRSEYGAYCGTVTSGTPPGSAVSDLVTLANLSPDPSTTGRFAKPFGCGTTCSALWTQLGARPAGDVRFGYGVAAGPPTTLPDDGSGGHFGFSAANADFWFVARAVGDLDGDATYVTFEGYSASKNIWIGDNNGVAISKGWE